MSVDECGFFREAALRICGSLQFERTMVRFLQYLRRFMPAGRLVLERFDEESGAARVVVHATPERGDRGDVPTALSNKAKKHIRRMFSKEYPGPALRATLTGRLHYACALLLFLLLAWISLFHFPQKPPGIAMRPTDLIQVIRALRMTACVLSIVVYYAFSRVESLETCFVFVAETVALIAFGVSWFTEGLDLERVIA